MTAPPPGWYPDPEAAGRQWRWWDGAQWAPPGYGYVPTFDPTAHAHTLRDQEYATRNAGRWLRWGIVAYAIAAVLGFALGAATLHNLRWDLGSGDPSASDAERFVALRVLAFPFQIGALGFFALLIAWIYNAGKFAEAQGWPAVRGRTLGAFSVIIPIVNFWWPYEAIRDCYPPGNHPPLVLRWWLAHVLLAAVGLSVALSAVGDATALSVVLVIVGAVVAVISVVLGWRLIDDVDAMQHAHVAP